MQKNISGLQGDCKVQQDQRMQSDSDSKVN